MLDAVVAIRLVSLISVGEKRLWFWDKWYPADCLSICGECWRKVFEKRNLCTGENNFIVKQDWGSKRCLENPWKQSDDNKAHQRYHRCWAGWMKFAHLNLGDLKNHEETSLIFLEETSDQACRVQLTWCGAESESVQSFHLSSSSEGCVISFPWRVVL